MKKLLLLGAALLSLCALGQTARAGGDEPSYYEEERPAPRYYEGHVVEHRCYAPPAVYIAPPPPPIVYAYPRPYYHRRYHYHPYGYGYGYGGYGYGPGVHIGIGF